MPFIVSRTASFYDKEVLKYPTGLDAIKSVVIDATDTATIVVDGAVRNVLPAGTLLKVSATNTTQYVKYAGVGRVDGVLARPVDILSNTTASDEPSPMLFHAAVFATTALVGFTAYASAVVSSLPTCKFE